MTSKCDGMCLVLVIAVVMLCHGAAAQSGCTGALMGLAPCLNYVTGNSSTPSSSCCSQLAAVVQSQPQCLCAMLNGGGGSSLGISVNQTLAMSLPGACNVQTPPVSRCNAVNGPASSPVSPPSDSSDTPDAPSTSSSSPSIPAGSGSKTVPSTQGTSDATINALQLIPFTMLIFFVASNLFNIIKF